MAIDKFVPSVISIRSRMPMSYASGAHIKNALWVPAVYARHVAFGAHAMCPSCHMPYRLAGRLVRVHTVRVFCAQCVA